MTSHKFILPAFLVVGALAVPLASSLLPPSTAPRNLPPIQIEAHPETGQLMSLDDQNYLEWLRRLRCDRFITEQTINQCQAAAAKYNDYELDHRRQHP